MRFFGVIWLLTGILVGCGPVEEEEDKDNPWLGGQTTLTNSDALLLDDLVDLGPWVQRENKHEATRLVFYGDRVEATKYCTRDQSETLYGSASFRIAKGEMALSSPIVQEKYVNLSDESFYCRLFLPQKDIILDLDKSDKTLYLKVDRDKTYVYRRWAT